MIGLFPCILAFLMQHSNTDKKSLRKAHIYCIIYTTLHGEVKLIRCKNFFNMVDTYT